MKRKFFICIMLLSLTIPFTECKANDAAENSPYFYRTKMIDFISDISSYAKNQKHDFGFITNNGLELYQSSEVPAGYAGQLLGAADGALIEGSQYTWDDNHNGGVQTSVETKKYITDSIAVLHSNNKLILSVDYCGDDKQNALTAIEKNNAEHIVTFPARYKELTSLEYGSLEKNDKNRDINTLNAVKSFIILLNPEKFTDKADYLSKLKTASADLLIIDLYYNGSPLSSEDLNYLKTKTDGHRRLVYSYMSIGEAEDYRYYWQTQWNEELPDWIVTKNDQWQGNYPVKYWHKEWQKIIYGTKNAYLDKIISAGFDGAFLDIVDGYQNFE